MDKSDWNEYAGCPNEFWAALGDRILHREIPEQEQRFWEEFKEGRNGKGFAAIDCEENRERLLQMYAAATRGDLVVRSQLNDYWRKLVITRFVLEPGSGFINPHEQQEVEESFDTQPTQQEQWEAWVTWMDSPETSVRDIDLKRRTDSSFAEFYRAMYANQVRTDDPMAEINARNNLHQPSPSTTTSTSRKVAPAEVQQFAVQYLRMSSEQLKALLSPVLNVNGPADAARVKHLMDEAIRYGLI
jgi:hypothetical protein